MTYQMLQIIEPHITSLQRRWGLAPAAVHSPPNINQVDEKSVHLITCPKVFGLNESEWQGVMVVAAYYLWDSAFRRAGRIFVLHHGAFFSAVDINFQKTMHHANHNMNIDNRVIISQDNSVGEWISLSVLLLARVQFPAMVDCSEGLFTGCSHSPSSYWGSVAENDSISSQWHRTTT